MTAICLKCGRDCRTALALGKHEAKGCDGKMEEVILTSENHNPEDFQPIVGHDVARETFEFSNWQETKGDFKTIAERCPKCANEIAQFWKKDEWVWVCLECGLNFTPRRKLRELLAIKDTPKAP